ncbi:uncharacterized protein I303_104717 [Kwoniella dejecticola CBS 10117]|uniref:DNA mismatch repair protein MutS core domain-containing protein n=1 Tax=Kwoniella dejecticola CBS 10117 TaxID=1296121 RepID=A0AAJ8KQZ4_9TREE
MASSTDEAKSIPFPVLMDYDRNRQRGVLNTGNKSAGPSTRASTRAEDLKDYIVAISQSRGEGVELGIAAHNLQTGHIDTVAFHKTIHHLSLHPPCSILTVNNKPPSGINSGSGNRLVERLQEIFELPCEGLPRDYWERDHGYDYISSLSVRGEIRSSTLMAISDKYFALCATSALFKHLEDQNLRYHRESLQIRYATSEGTMFIDTETAKNLELVSNSLTHKSNGTLLGSLNRCLTPMGYRLLQSNILQPCNVKDIILTRLDAVGELLSSPERLRDIRESMEKLTKTDLDKLINQATRDGSGKRAENLTENRISILLQLERYIQAAKHLTTELSSCKSKMLREIHDELADPALCVVQTEIQKQHRFTCRLEPTGNKYRLCVNIQDLDGENLPSECINVERKKSRVSFTTHELLQRNAKSEQAQQEILSLSSEVVAALLVTVMGDCSDSETRCIGRLCGIRLSSKDKAPLVRPDFTDNIAVRAGRHPILDRTLNADECVPNDIYVVRGHASFQLIQGPNMSGKSTFLRQVGLLTVQAMLGCYRLSNDGKWLDAESSANEWRFTGQEPFYVCFRDGYFGDDPESSDASIPSPHR